MPHGFFSGESTFPLCKKAMKEKVQPISLLSYVILKNVSLVLHILHVSCLNITTVKIK